MDPKEPDFRPLHNTIDSFFRKLHSEGVGTNPQQSAIISHGEEELLWSTDVMGTSNPKQLLHAFFFYCGLNLCLRGGNEHRALKFRLLGLKRSSRCSFSCICSGCCYDVKICTPWQNMCKTIIVML